MNRPVKLGKQFGRSYFVRENAKLGKFEMYSSDGVEEFIELDSTDYLEDSFMSGQLEI